MSVGTVTTFELTINAKSHTIEAAPEMPLLWVIRDLVGLTGTKFGCGAGHCGSCTVHVDGTAVRSCSFPVSGAVNKKITTIEGLSENDLHPLQKAWDELNVPQCGYCQVGQIMTAAAWMKEHSNPSDEDINAYQAGNLCRCGTYERIRAAIKRAAEL